ncbi:hypothetical protein [Caminicella sporogenes]|uniref:hypothetical protein n=1 Tax=Caminicella sporogenes TaxID=166485 RepID=UPI002541C2FC|nr:hypothetical protein [Caminicella sporogenes]WIF94296.1 hypothetical protein QNI18_08365 [Caminicella sporogenes]
MKDVKYIYNIKQINFYLENNIKPVKIDIHKKTKKVFAVFDTQETEEVYKKWCERIKN